MNMVSQSILTGKSVDINSTSFFKSFESVAVGNIHKEAIIFEEERGRVSVTYEELNNYSNQLARLLIKLGGDNLSNPIRVMLCANYSEKIPIIILAILKAGMVYLPVDTEYPEHRIKHILADGKPQLVILDDNFAQSDIYSHFKTIKIKQLFHESAKESDVNIKNEGSNVMLILYTSGSTGVPKGVELLFSSLMNRFIWQWREFPFDMQEKYCIVKSALTFIDSVCEMWAPLLQGNTLIIVPREVTKNPETLLPILEKYKIQRIILVPAQLRSLLSFLRNQTFRYELNYLKLWISTGEALKPTIIRNFFTLFNNEKVRLANFYGSTELSGDVTYYVYKKDDPLIESQTVPIGIPVYNTNVYVIDDSMKILPENERGEIVVSGRMLASGYVQENNTEKFMDNHLISNSEHLRIHRTGDYGKIENQLIWYMDRQDNQVKVRGHRFDLFEIENTASLIPLVKNAVAISFHSEGNNDPDIICFIEIEAGIKIHQSTIEDSLCRLLMPHMIPKVIIIDQIPLLSNMKADRKRLMEIAKENLTIKTNRTEFDFSGIPTDYLNKAAILYSSLAQILRLQNVGMIQKTSGFYNLGGNSLNSVETIIKLQEQGYYISIKDFISSKTMLEILEKMRNIEENNKPFDEFDHYKSQYTTEFLGDIHKEDVIQIFVESFARKSSLRQWNEMFGTKIEMFLYINRIYDTMVEGGLSFIIRSKATGEVIGISFNIDGHETPSETSTSLKSKVILDLLELLQRPVWERFNPLSKKQIFYEYLSATKDNLTDAENVALFHYMEHECIKVAKHNEFRGIFTINTNQLTLDLAKNMMGFKVIMEYQLNQYEHKTGLKPFRRAPDSVKIASLWKEI